MPAATRSRPTGPQPAAVVGIGASAGGLIAARALLQALPESSGAAFVFVQHLDPSQPSRAVELLAKSSKLPVVQATDKQKIAADCVYVAPPNRELTVRQGKLQVTPLAKRQGPHLTIDPMFRSLATEYGERAVAIVLSGAGNDGALGVRAIKERAGLVLVQTPETAEFADMPRNAVASGAADKVIPVEAMPEALARFLRNQSLAPGGRVDAEEGVLLEDILSVLRERGQLDFRQYKRDTLMRRVSRRMALHDVSSFAAYLALLKKRPDEATLLARDLLIRVTAFFREPEAFAALGDQVIAPLARDRSATAPIRIWVPGCATGEEAYSIGMLLLERFAEEGARRDVQIFATDMSEEALAIARTGVYPPRIEAEMDTARLRQFFVRSKDGRYQVAKPLREMVTFARQNLIGDPPFSQLDLVSCRNLLIYLAPEMQGRITELFHFALHRGGHLFLGPSETIGMHGDLFEPVSKRWRIYRRLEPLQRNHVEFSFGSPRDTRLPVDDAAHASAPVASGLWDQAFPLLLSHFDVAAAIIDRQHRVLRLSGKVDEYLSVPVGEPRFDLLSLAREGLRPALRAATRRAFARGARAHSQPVRLRQGKGSIRIQVSALPLSEAHNGPDVLLVLFNKLPGGKRTAQGSTVGTVESDLVADLESELRITQERLQRTLEETKATHEEVVSMNEELQSSNEELETSKEELQSVNEELATVNSQLQEKVEELEGANNDTLNLLQSSDTPTFFLDDQLRIRRYTCAAQRILNVIPSDVGRPVGNIVWRFRDPALEEDARAVIATGEAREREVQGDEGLWFQRRILPYRSADGRVLGAVITLSDVTRLKQAEQHWRRLAAVVADSNDALTLQEFSGRIVAWNRAAARMYGYEEGQAVGQNGLELIVPEELHPEMLQVMGRLERGESVEPFETRRVCEDGRVLHVWLTVTAVRDERGRPCSFATTERDITERKQAEEALRRSERFANAILEMSPFGIQVFGADGKLLRENAVQRGLPRLTHHDMLDPATAVTPLGEAFRRAYAGEVVELPEVTLRGGEAQEALTIEQVLFPVRDEQGRVHAVVSLCHDVSARKAARERETEKLESLGLLAGGVAHDFNNLLSSILGHVSIALGTLPSEHAARSHLEVALSAVDRAADLTGQMLAYSGRGAFQLRCLDLSSIVQENLSLLKAGIAKRIRLEIHLAELLPAIEADAGQVQQVVMNLIANAADAIGEAEGCVTVRTEACEVSAAEAEKYGRLTGIPPAPGRYVALQVSDTGRGMDAATQARIFEPFFTTKATGHGLGLAAVLGIVRGHGGGILLESAPGRGTTMTVLFPAGGAAELPATERKSPAFVARSADSLVLVVDDEAMVRDVVARFLESGGYKVLQACDGSEAVLLFREHAHEVGVVLLDLSMPGPSPAETLRALRAIDPNVRVILTSGYADGEARRNLSDVAGFIAKPARAGQYLDAVQKCLDGASA